MGREPVAVKLLDVAFSTAIPRHLLHQIIANPSNSLYYCRESGEIQ
jgi:hypothetical protein